MHFDPPQRWHADAGASPEPEDELVADDEMLVDVGKDGPCEWYYVDDERMVQGPFWSEEMDAWRDRGWLPGGLRVCRSSNGHPVLERFYPVAAVSSFFKNGNAK